MQTKVTFTNNSHPSSTLATAIRTYDVVVIGAGPIGLFYATMLKQMRPHTTIAVLDRKANPGHKVGESTLSTTVRALRAMGLSLPVMRRLFGNKAGLRFFNTHPDTDQLLKQIDVVDIEETFQVERRVLEMALQERARQRGIDLLTETTCLVRESEFAKTDPNGASDEAHNRLPMHRLICQRPTGERLILQTPMVCDASGPASVLPKHFGFYRKDMEMYDTFNYNAYYAYFKVKKTLPVQFWDYPATRHITFPGGWLWFITLTSWENTPDANLMAVVKRLLNHPEGNDESYPTRYQLEAQCGAESEQIVSIGFTIRADQDEAQGTIAERFAHYVNKHPAIRWVMEHYELIERPYLEHKSPWFSFANMAHDVTQAAGDGWCVIGDAAIFTNPIFSPGLTFGTATAYMAARDTAAGFAKGDLSQAAFASYEVYTRTLFDALLDDTDTLYRSFAHVDSYERVLANRFFTGAADVIARVDYSETDPYVWDFLEPVNMQRAKQIKSLFQAGEVNGDSPATTADEINRLITPYIADLTARPEVAALRLGRFFSFYDDQGHYVEQKQKARGIAQFARCSCCCLFVDDSLPDCPVCGTPVYGDLYTATLSARERAAELPSCKCASALRHQIAEIRQLGKRPAQQIEVVGLVA